jgi:hypothetical protein
MDKKADPGMTGSPIQGIWPQRPDPPLYIPGNRRSNRGHAWMFGDFWNFPQDKQEDENTKTYPEPNAWRRTRAPFALGNIPSIQEIEEGAEDLMSPWYGSPRSPWYHGNDFMIEGPYGDSGGELSDNFFYNNLVPISRGYQNYPIEKMLKDVRDRWYNYYNVKKYLDKTKRKPTLPTKNREMTPTLWDFMGEPIGPNTTYYGNEPSTGGGWAPSASNESIKKYADNNIDEIKDLVDRINHHRGSLEYNTVSQYINPLIDATKDIDSLNILAKKIRFFTKILSVIDDKKAKIKIILKIKNIIKDFLKKIFIIKKDAKFNSDFNWYDWYQSST